MSYVLNSSNVEGCRLFSSILSALLYCVQSYLRNDTLVAVAGTHAFEMCKEIKRYGKCWVRGGGSTGRDNEEECINSHSGDPK